MTILANKTTQKWGSFMKWLLLTKSTVEILTFCHPATHFIANVMHFSVRIKFYVIVWHCIMGFFQLFVVAKVTPPGSQQSSCRLHMVHTLRRYVLCWCFISGLKCVLLTEQTAAGLDEITPFKASHPKEMYGTIQKRNIGKPGLGSIVPVPRPFPSARKYITQQHLGFWSVVCRF